MKRAVLLVALLLLGCTQGPDPILEALNQAPYLPVSNLPWIPLEHGGEVLAKPDPNARADGGVFYTCPPGYVLIPVPTLRSYIRAAMSAEMRLVAK